jgi:flagellar biosynthesis chaperone FliJ
VRETRPITERIALLQTRQDAFLSYTSNQEIPERVRTALQRAVTLRNAVNAAEADVLRAETRRNSLLAEQDRIRKNIEAAGNQSSQGQEYLRRLQSLDNDIDNNTQELERLRTAVANAQKAYEDYLNGLNL